MSTDFQIATSTASLCIFDPDCLKHRLHDTPDWWADPFEEIVEVNDGNTLIVGLGQDGTYSVRLVDTQVECRKSITGLLRCSSGNIFIGPGEDITGGELEPHKRQTTGRFIRVPPATYAVTVGIVSVSDLTIHFGVMDRDAKNNFKEQLLLFQ